ncbi:MAG TPA: hypothetical protein PK530_11225 [Anaerolineales bacterium]|nr:hypothetical protein [Anaerolineales bacterium]
MNTVTVIIGSGSLLTGIASIFGAIFFRTNRRTNFFLGIFFALVGMGIIVLSSQGNSTYMINIGLSENQSGFLLLCCVMSIFLLKGILTVKEGTAKLKTENLSSHIVLRSKFQIAIALLLSIFAVFILFLAFIRFWL